MRIFLLLLSLPPFTCFALPQAGPGKPTREVLEAIVLKTCFDTGKDCGSVATENPKAEKAFLRGCGLKDYYACYRLGQFIQYAAKPDYQKAIKYYEIACAGKDTYGCESAYEIHMELCFDKEIKEYCGKKDPQGVYRFYAYLQNFDPKLIDGIIQHNFDSGPVHEKSQKLFEKLVNEKNKKLLEALKLSKKKGKHDGADAESLTWTILKMEGKPIPEGF